MSVATQLLTDSWEVSFLGEFEQGPTKEEAPYGEEWIPAQVPGAIQYDLMRAGSLENPFGGTSQAKDAAWVARGDWAFRTTFMAGEAMPGLTRELVFFGIDTFSDIWLNGSLLGTTANAYRTYRFAADSHLINGSNELLIHVKGHHRMIQPLVTEAREKLDHADGVEGLLGKSLIRRYQRNFFTNSSLLNLGTGILGIGIYKDVALVTRSQLTIVDARPIVAERQEGTATVVVAVSVAGGDIDGAEVRVTLQESDGSAAVTGLATLKNGTVEVTLEVDSPRYWYPRGYGEAFLYNLTAEVLVDEEVVDSKASKVGLRTVSVLERLPDGRPTYQIVVNDVPIYVRGTNFIPLDYIKVHAPWESYERMFQLVIHGNNNMIRMWGGGAVELDRFYDECDRLGIMLWQDFYLHSNTYPDYNTTWVEEFRHESIEFLGRIRNHASLTIICGGNEQREGWDEYGWRDRIDRFYGEKLITEVLPPIAADLCPELPYIDNSPHGSMWVQSPVDGESHIWGNYFNSTKDPQFVTESCWTQESYSRPETLKETMGLDVDSMRGKNWTSKWTELTSLPILIRFPFTGYHNAGGLREYLRGLEFEQGLADYFAFHMLRLRGSSCHGLLYWSLNKGGPLFQFGSIDYGGRPLISHYIMRRLYTDIAVGIYRDIDDVRVTVSNASAAASQILVRITHTSTNGEIKDVWSVDTNVEANSLSRIITLENLFLKVRDRRREVVMAEVLVDGEVVSNDLLIFAPFGEISSPDPEFKTSVTRSGETWLLNIESPHVAKMVELHCSDHLLFSENYFPMLANNRVQIAIEELPGANDGPHEITLASVDCGTPIVITLD